MSREMKLFITGATGYIGGSVAMRLLQEGHHVIGLARSESRAQLLRDQGIEPLIGTLDDADLLAQAALDADAVINAASSDHLGAVQAMLKALAGSGKKFIHTSGSSIVGTRAGGTASEDVFDETTPFEPSPARAARVALNKVVTDSVTAGVHAVIVCPSLIYGEGRGVHRDSMQVPWLINLAQQSGVARHVGPGENIWSNVHIDDLVKLYALALNKAPAGGFYFAENGENSMHEVCEAINRTLGLAGASQPMSADEAAAVWGDGPANDTMGSNSRVRSLAARAQLGWQPAAPSLLAEIERGYYAVR